MKMINLFKKTTLAAGAAIALSTVSADAAVISVNFDDGGNTITGSTGAVSAGNWNELTFGAAGNPVTLSALKDDSGAATTAEIALENESAGSGDGFDAALSGATGEAAKLFTHRNRNGGAVATVTGLPGSFQTSTYDVYVYAGLSDATLKLDDGTTITEVAMDANGDGSSFVEATGGTTFDDEGAGNYYVFRGLSSSSFTLTTGDAIVDGQGENNGFVYGMQIVEVPEPGSLALLGLGGLLIGARRRRG